jgi:hypothetical protein
MESKTNSTISTDQTKPRPLYARLIGDDCNTLDEPLQQTYLSSNVREYAGLFSVVHHSKMLAWLGSFLFPVPAAGSDQPTRLIVTPHSDGEKWHRIIGDVDIISEQYESSGGRLDELMGIINFRFRLEVVSRVLIFNQEATFLQSGPFSIRLPKWLSPKVSGRSWIDESSRRVQVKISVSAPLVGPLFSYEGYIEKRD